MKKEENITTNPDTNIIEKKAKSSKVKNVSSKTENKEIAVVEEKSKTVKKVPKKHQEKLPKKKLPKMFKKKYSAKGLKKKLLSKIFIAEDKKYVTSLFEETKIGKKEKIVFKIPDDKLFSLVELKRLKVLAKQINKQKGTVKFIPLFLFIIIVVSVFLFTDLILKIGLKSTLQSIFKAKTSIGSVHLDYMESSLSIKNLVVADKEAPMTNLFQFDSIIFDIDINRLLQKSIVIDEIEAAGFAMGTERQTSGELIIKEKVKKEKKPKEPIIKPEFIENAKAKFSTELQKMFGKFDPKVILETTYKSLKTPVVAKRVTE